MSFSQTIREYKASKAVLFWACAGCVVATMVVGFTWGGWTTAGAAEERAEVAARQAVAQLAADICVNRYLDSPDARANLTALNDESAYSRDGIIEEGGWVTLGDREDPIPGAAELCADRLAEVEMGALPKVPVAKATTALGTEATAVQ